MNVVLVMFFAAYLSWVIWAGIYKGLIREEMPGYFGAEILYGREARRHGWLMIILGIVGFVILAGTILMAKYG